MTLRVQSGSAQLHGIVAGPAQDPTIVFLHAGVADHRSWQPVVDELSQDHRVVAYDRRGFGATTYRPESYADVDDLVAVLDAVGAEQVMLVGNSQGGRVALDFALAHPQRVLAIVLIAPAVSGDDGNWSSLPPKTADLVARIEAAEVAADVDQLNELEAQLWLDGPRSRAGRVGGAARALFLNMNGRALRASSPGEHRAGEAAAHRLAELAMPVQVIAGDLDLELIIDRSRRVADAAPQGRLTVLAGVAHVPQLEDPARIVEAIREMFR